MKANKIIFDRIKKSPYKEDSKLNYHFRLQDKMIRYQNYCNKKGIPDKMYISDFIGVMSSTLQ